MRTLDVTPQTEQAEAILRDLDSTHQAHCWNEEERMEKRKNFYFGCAKGEMIILPSFYEPMEEMKPYM